MTITKYVYENFTGTGFMWHPVTEEGDVLFYPCGDLKGVKAFVGSLWRSNRIPTRRRRKQLRFGFLRLWV